MKATRDWESIRQEFIISNLGPEAFIEKHNLPARSFYSHAKRGFWQQEKTMFRTESAREIQRKAMESAVAAVNPAEADAAQLARVGRQFLLLDTITETLRENGRLTTDALDRVVDIGSKLYANQRLLLGMDTGVPQSKADRQAARVEAMSDEELFEELRRLRKAVPLPDDVNVQ